MPRIRTDHLLLRHFCPADESDWARVVLTNPVTMRALPAGGPAPRERAATILADVRDHWQEHGHGLWAVELLANGALIGQAGLQRIDSGPRVELSVALCPPHGRGDLPQEVARAVLRHGFEVACLAEVMAVVLPANRDARKLWRRLGMQPRGRVHLYEQRLPMFRLRRGDFVSGEERYDLDLEEEPHDPAGVTCGRQAGATGS